MYVAVRFVLYVDLMLLFGLPLFQLYAPVGTRVSGAFTPIALALVPVGLIASMLSIGLMASSMADVGLADLPFDALRAVIFETASGTAWIIRMVALMALLATRRGGARPTGRVMLSGIALASLAWTGHGAGGEGTAGTVRLIADLGHLLAAGAWLGALVHLTSLVWRPDSDIPVARMALERFSGVGTVLVGMLVVTGAANGAALMGWQGLKDPLVTLYGKLLLVKLMLFAGMLCLAGANRFWLTPSLSRSDSALSRVGLLRSSVLLEIGLAIAILGLVGWLGTLEPAGSM